MTIVEEAWISKGMWFTLCFHVPYDVNKNRMMPDGVGLLLAGTG